MSIIDDFKDINRRMNRKPEPVANVAQAFPYNAFVRSLAVQSIRAYCSFRERGDDEAAALIEQYDRDATNCAAKRPQGI